MEEIKSIWDGWEKQCFGTLNDGAGATCAVGYIYNGLYMKNTDGAFCRVEEYLRRHYPIRTGGSPIVYANNVLKLTPQQFRDIDIASQLEAAVKPLVDSVEVGEKVTT